MKLRYCHTMLKSLKGKISCDLSDISTDSLPADVLEIIENHKDFSSSRTFGKKGLGSPEEYEILEVQDDSSTRTFEYFNKGISFMMSGTAEDRPAFKVFAHLTSTNRSNQKK